MITFLLSSSPAALTLIGALIAAGSGLFLAVAVSGTKRPHHKATAGLALGLSLMIVMGLWNGVLDAGFNVLGLEPDAVLAVQESGGFLDDLTISGQVAIITALAVAIVTVALVIILGLIQRALLAQSAPQAPQAPQVATPATAHPDTASLPEM